MVVTISLCTLEVIAVEYVDLEVIKDNGGESTLKYLKPSKDSKNRQDKRLGKRLASKLINAHFPVVTKLMTVGPVGEEEAKNIKFQMATQPMFIVGYDPVSIAWLKTNREMLEDSKAIGLVVNVPSLKEMDELQNLVGKSIILQPTPGDRLSEHLKIKHYPFYLDHKGVMR